MARDPYKLYPHDYVLRATVLRVIPSFVKPNSFTVARMALTPVVVYLLAIGNFTYGVPLFVLAACTDAIDGALARTRRQITPWGILFDPVADKLLIGLVVLTIALRHYHPVLVGATILFDVVPLGVWLLRTRQRRPIMMANMWGKAKMLLQFCSITLLLVGLTLQVQGLIDAGEVVLAVAAVVALIAAVTYSL